MYKDHDSLGNEINMHADNKPGCENCALAMGLPVTTPMAAQEMLSEVPEKTDQEIYEKEVTNIELVAEKVELIPGEDTMVNVVTTPENYGTPVLVWESSDLESAIVNQAGQVIAGTKTGEVTITATNPEDNTITGSVSIDIVDKPGVKVTKITLSETTKTIDKGGKFTLSVTKVEPEEATNKEVTWSSNNGNATVNAESGEVTGVKAGQAIISATAKDGSGVKADCTVTVNPKLVTGITLSETSKTVTRGESFKLTATIAPTDADNKQIEWSSNADDKASVNSEGNVTTKAAGSAVITAKSKDGSEKTATCNVTINAKKVTAITVDPATKSVQAGAGNKFTLTANVTPADADNKGVTWSSDSEHATVNAETGEVTPVSAGTANITATAKDGSGKTGKCVVTVTAAKKVK